jgi:hypothetical protein
MAPKVFKGAAAGAVLVFMLLIAICYYTVQLVRLVHSDLRLLCGVDAAVGVLVGWQFGSPLLGTLIGGAFGALSYRIVSMRILKLAPKRA